MLPGVDQQPTVRVTLEFEPGSDPPRGRLLTGQALEPAFVVTKPFDTTSIKVGVSQALFFAGKP